MFNDQPLGMTLVAAGAVPRYRIVLGSGANYGGAAVAGASFASIVGVAQNEPLAGEHLSVAILGQSRCYVNSALSAFQLFTSAGSAGACPAASGDTLLGMAMETGAPGDLIRVLLLGPQRFAG